MTFDLTFHLWAIKKSSSTGRPTILPDLVLAGLPSFAALSSSVFSASTSDCSSTSTVGLTRELAALEMFADRCAWQERFWKTLERSQIATVLESVATVLRANYLEKCGRLQPKRN